MLFTQDLGTKRSTSGRSSMNTLWEDHEARHKSTLEVNMTTNDPRTPTWRHKTPRTWTEHAEACATRIQALTMKETTSKAHMQVHTNKESRKKQPGRNRGRNRPGPAGLGRPAQPTSRRVWRPFALGVRLFIASSSVGRHIDPIILPSPITRKPPPQDEGESWMSSRQGSTPAEGRKQEEDSKPLA
jgi:hypothetical protein